MWDSPQGKLAERRRDFGPIKDRSKEWTPPSILPKLDECLKGSSIAIEKGTQARNLNAIELLGMGSKSIVDNNRASPPIEPATQCPATAGENSNTLEEAYDDNDGTLTSFSTQGCFLPMESYDLGSFFPQNPISFQQVEFYPSLSSITPASQPSMTPTLSLNDNEALSYFRTTFSHLKSTRNQAWSAHAVFLYQSTQKQTALHFLLAVSHNEFAIHSGVSSDGPNLPHEVREHYERGSNLLLQSMTGQASSDHVGDLISFLYMYMFWMRRDTVYPQRLKQISKGVLTYVTTHDVVSICGRVTYKSFSSNLSGNVSEENAQTDSALLARILIYIYDRDVYCAFYGCGGHFADYLDTDPEQRRNLFAISRTSLLRYWGKDYPRDEFIQDIEQARTHEMYFDLITICQQINIFSQNFPSAKSGEMDRILRRRLDSHEIVSFDFSTTE